MSKKIIELPNDFTPRDYQERPMEYMDKGGRRVFWVVHRRAGKDLTFIHQTAKMAHTRIGAYWHIFPSFAQAKKAIWEGFTSDGKRILENCFPGFLNPGKNNPGIVLGKDDNSMGVRFKNGSVWRLIGSDRIEVVGAGPVGVVFSEYALSNPRGWNMIRPMLRENGGWAAFITTPRGHNHAYDLYQTIKHDKDWFCEVLPLEKTGAWKTWKDNAGNLFESPQAVKDAEIADGMPEPLTRQEYDCDWNAALVGSVWGEQIEDIIRVGGYDEFVHGYDQVFTSWDLGYTDSTAIWFWRVENGGIDVIDCYSANNKPLTHFFEVVDRKPYRYVKHWLPHDSRQTTLASGVSILNLCLRNWPGMVQVGPDLPLVDGLQAGRWLLQQGVRFHKRCKEGVEALRQYHYDYDEEKKTFAARPVHDWTSHFADAWRYTAAVVKVSELLTNKGKPKVEAPVAKPLHYTFTMNQLFEDRERDVAARRRF